MEALFGRRLSHRCCHSGGHLPDGCGARLLGEILTDSPRKPSRFREAATPRPSWSGGYFENIARCPGEAFSGRQAGSARCYSRAGPQREIIPSSDRAFPGISSTI